MSFPRHHKTHAARAERSPHDDPRRILLERKFFGKRPQPLEQYLYKHHLPRMAERVFWLHWDLGAFRGDFTSEISASEVAERCWCVRRSVFYAYRRLQDEGLLRRQDPGRVNPQRQSIAITEVLLPSSALRELLTAPERAVPARFTSEPQVLPMRGEDAEAAAALTAKHGPRAMRVVLAKCSTAERDRLQVAQREAQAGQAFAFTADVNTKLDPLDVGFIRHFLQRYVNEARALQPQQIAAQSKLRGRARVLNTFSLAYVRKQLTEVLAAKEVEERFREIVWSVEEGNLARFEVRHAINIALKKVRSGAWTRPKRMPSSWRRLTP